MFKRLLPALPCTEQSMPHVFRGTPHKLAASVALEWVALTFCAGQVVAIARKAIARRLTLWVFQPT